MMEDFRQTGKCNFAIARKNFDNYHESWLVRKEDRYAESYNMAYTILLGQHFFSSK